MDIYTTIMATIIIVSSLFGMFTVASRIIERRIENQFNKRMEKFENELKELNRGKA